MALSPAQLKSSRSEWVEQVLGSEPCQFTKAELDDAATAIDGWIAANATSFNAALPLPFRTQATPAQKAGFFMLVLTRRFGR